MFIGRMLQHILQKVFQQICHYELQSTVSFKKWYEIIAKSAVNLVDDMIIHINGLKYSYF